MNSLPNLNHAELDKEWIVLLQTAKMMGLSIEEVKLYIANFTAIKQTELDEHNSAYTESAVTEMASS